MGEKEAVALMRGVTHDERVESELSSDRKEEQEEVMLAGMRMLSVEFAVLFVLLQPPVSGSSTPKLVLLAVPVRSTTVFSRVWMVSSQKKILTG